MPMTHAPSSWEEEGPLFRDDAGVSVLAETDSDLGIWRWDLDAGTVELSAALMSMLGLNQVAFAGSPQDLFEIVHPDDRQRVAAELQAAVRQRRPFSWQARINRPDGGERTLLAQGSASDSTTGNEIVAMCADISSRENATSAIGRLERRLTHIIAESPAMICIKDLEHRYRIVNNATVRITGVPAEKLIGRTATEAIPEIGPAIDAQARAALATRETVHEDMQLTTVDGVRIFHLTSFALNDHVGTPVETCCIATDVTDSRRRQADARLRREATELISSAVRENRLVAVSQPVTDISGVHTVSEELLIRLHLPANGPHLQPSVFLPNAEQFNLVQAIDIWMVLRALKIAPLRPVQVNLSAVTVSDAHARETIIAALQRTPKALGRVIFEITETAAVHHLDAAATFAKALNDLGYGLALDDFGTGFGSFTYLQRLPLRYLKIDRSFVTGLAVSAHDRKVVASIINIAKEFGLWTIAEGVENADTLSILGELGADFAQGFHLGRPQPLT
jgi:PAS domain S-box-containing protein